MVQIYEDQPSFGSQFIKSNMDTGTALAKALLGEKSRQKQSTDENEAFKRMGIDLSGIRDPEMRKTIVTEMLKGQTAQIKAAPKIQEAQKKEQKKLEDAQIEQQGMRDALDWLDENAEYAGDPIVPGKSFLGGAKKGERYTVFDLPLNRKAAGVREEIDNTGFWLTDKIYTHFNKGQISNVKLNLIKESLAPHSGLSEREYKARVSALRRIANLPPDAPKYVVDDAIEREAKALKKIESAGASKKEKERPSLESFHR